MRSLDWRWLTSDRGSFRVLDAPSEVNQSAQSLETLGFSYRSIQAYQWRYEFEHSLGTWQVLAAPSVLVLADVSLAEFQAQVDTSGELLQINGDIDLIGLSDPFFKEPLSGNSIGGALDLTLRRSQGPCTWEAEALRLVSDLSVSSLRDTQATLRYQGDRSQASIAGSSQIVSHDVPFPQEYRLSLGCPGSSVALEHDRYLDASSLRFTLRPSGYPAWHIDLPSAQIGVGWSSKQWDLDVSWLTNAPSAKQSLSFALVHRF